MRAQGAELVAQKWGVTRDEMEEMAVESHRRAADATAKGLFKREVVPVMGQDPKTGKVRTGGHAGAGAW